MQNLDSNNQVFTEESGAEVSKENMGPENGRERRKSRREMRRSKLYLRTALAAVSGAGFPKMRAIKNEIGYKYEWEQYLDPTVFHCVQPDPFRRRVFVTYRPDISLAILCSNGASVVFSYTITRPEERRHTGNVRKIVVAIGGTEYSRDIETKIHPDEWEMLVEMMERASDKVTLLANMPAKIRRERLAMA